MSGVIAGAFGSQASSQNDLANHFNKASPINVPNTKQNLNVKPSPRVQQTAHGKTNAEPEVKPNAAVKKALKEEQESWEKGLLGSDDDDNDMSGVFSNAFGSTANLREEKKLQPDYGNIKPPEQAKPEPSTAQSIRQGLTTPPSWAQQEMKAAKSQEPRKLDGCRGSQQSLQSTGSAGGPITCEKLLLISKGMTERVFKNLDDYFLGPEK